MPNYDVDEKQRTGYDHTSPRSQSDLINKPSRFQKLKKKLGKQNVNPNSIK